VPYPYFPADALDWIDRAGADPDNLVYTIHREKLIGVVSLEGGGRSLSSATGWPRRRMAAAS
jgi:hypothetical protein